MGAEPTSDKWYQGQPGGTVMWLRGTEVLVPCRGMGLPNGGTRDSRGSLSLGHVLSPTSGVLERSGLCKQLWGAQKRLVILRAEAACDKWYQSQLEGTAVWAPLARAPGIEWGSLSCKHVLSPTSGMC